MNKLYGLYVARDKDAILDFVCASNKVQKLKDITFVADSTWNLCGKVERDQGRMQHTNDGIYPYYIIYEIPYVC